MIKSAGATQFFYKGKTLVTLRTAGRARGIFRTDNQCLAECGTESTHLLATDVNDSVISVDTPPSGEFHSYTAYGYASTLPTAKTLNGFNGEMLHRLMRCYLLGAGYRAFNPAIFRFHSPDSWSPFGLGGLNAYAYCNGDPVNMIDPSGHSGFFTRLFKGLGNVLGLRQRRLDTTLNTSGIYRKLSTTSVGSDPTSFESTYSPAKWDTFSSSKESLNTYSMVSEITPASMKSLPSNFGSSLSPPSPTLQVPRRDPKLAMRLWLSGPDLGVHEGEYKGLAQDILKSSERRSLVVRLNGARKNKALAMAARKYPASASNTLYEHHGKALTRTQSIQRFIREFQN
nr:RHS repeat-associated core domain-containing protein [uncultured Pseudomonas sp.]